MPLTLTTCPLNVECGLSLTPSSNIPDLPPSQRFSLGGRSPFIAHGITVKEPGQLTRTSKNVTLHTFCIVQKGTHHPKTSRRLGQLEGLRVPLALPTNRLSNFPCKQCRKTVQGKPQSPKAMRDANVRFPPICEKAFKGNTAPTPTVE